MQAKRLNFRVKPNKNKIFADIKSKQIFRFHNTKRTRNYFTELQNKQINKNFLHGYKSFASCTMQYLYNTGTVPVHGPLGTHENVF
jgi:hypothetical protein